MKKHKYGAEINSVIPDELDFHDMYQEFRLSDQGKLDRKQHASLDIALSLIP